MSRRARVDGARFVRVLVLVLLAAGPLLGGAIHAPVYVPFLAGSAVAGAAAYVRARRDGARPPLPGARLLLALNGLVLLQLVPMPPGLLRLVSPGSFSFYNDHLLLPLTAWRPISVSPPDTVAGLTCLAAFSLLYLAVFREMAGSLWRRRLMRTVVGAGAAITVVAFLQAVSPEPRKIYGIFQPRWDWAVFGPYVNRNHFAGYLVLATPLAMGFALEAFSRLRSARGRSRRGWLLVGEREGTAAVRWSAVVMVLVAGLLASQSRGGVSAFAVVTVVFLLMIVFGRALPLTTRERRWMALAGLVLVAAGLYWVGLGGVVSAFEVRGVRASRLDLWRDMLPMVPRFPVFGDGWNAFATAYPWYQTIWRTEWIGEAHNDYLQVLLDGGVVGLLLVAGLLVVVFRGALARAPRSPLDLGLFAALLALALHEVVDFNGQIPANAATWISLAALAVAPVRDPPHAGDPTHPVP
jgi:O-antigen ligase